MALLYVIKPELFDDFLSQNKTQVIEHPSVIATPLRDENNLRVCVWNLRAYLDTYRVKDGISQKAPKPESEKQKIVQTLIKINPDVLGIVEIGGKANLLEFAKLLSENGLNYPYMTVSEDRADYPQTAILSKISIDKVQKEGKGNFDYFGEDAHSYRGILLASFNAKKQKWKFGVLHLKSRYGAKKRDPEFNLYRQKECREIAKVLRPLLKANEKIIIGGDFNDEPNDKSINILKDSGLKIVPQKDTRGNSHTYFWAKKNESKQFDFFMSSPALAPYLQEAKVLPIIKGASDHAPIFVDIPLQNN